MRTFNYIKFAVELSRCSSVLAHPDLGGEVSGSSPGHTKDYKNGTYCTSAYTGHNELEWGEYIP